MIPVTTRSLRVAGVVALVVALAACGPSYKRRVIETGSKVEIILRGEKDDEDLVDQGFAHPIDVSGVRVTHILAQLDVNLYVRSVLYPGRQPFIPSWFASRGPFESGLACVDT